MSSQRHYHYNSSHSPSRYPTYPSQPSQTYASYGESEAPSSIMQPSGPSGTTTSTSTSRPPLHQQRSSTNTTTTNSSDSNSNYSSGEGMGMGYYGGGTGYEGYGEGYGEYESTSPNRSHPSTTTTTTTNNPNPPQADPYSSITQLPPTHSTSSAYKPPERGTSLQQPYLSGELTGAGAGGVGGSGAGGRAVKDGREGKEKSPTKIRPGTVTADGYAPSSSTTSRRSHQSPTSPSNPNTSPSYEDPSSSSSTSKSLQSTPTQAMTRTGMGYTNRDGDRDRERGGYPTFSNTELDYDYSRDGERDRDRDRDRERETRPTSRPTGTGMGMGPGAPGSTPMITSTTGFTSDPEIAPEMPIREGGGDGGIGGGLGGLGRSERYHSLNTPQGEYPPGVESGGGGGGEGYYGSGSGVGGGDRAGGQGTSTGSVTPADGIHSHPQSAGDSDLDLGEKASQQSHSNPLTSQQARDRDTQSDANNNEVVVLSPPLHSAGFNLNGFGLGGGMDERGREVISFDEGLLRTLCDLDCALPLITERIKQSIASCKQFATFLRSRAELEEKYARSISEMVRMSHEGYSRNSCKAGTFSEAYIKTLRVHETLAQNRLRFAQRLVEASEELSNLAKETERQRKLHKETGSRYERNVQEAEMQMEKAKGRFDTTAEELERILIAKEGENLKESGNISTTTPPSSKENKRGLGKAMAKGGMLFKAKGPAQMQKQEDEVRQRMNSASEVFRKAVQDNQGAKQEYFSLRLPKILRALKECADEIDMGTQYHMSRYTYLLESTILADGSAVSPVSADDGVGMRAIIGSIDNRADFEKYMQGFNAARGSTRAPRRAGQYEENFTPALPPHVQASQLSQTTEAQPRPSSSTVNGDSSQTASTLTANIPGAYASASIGGATFGVHLSQQPVSEGTEVPKVVEKCAEAIEAYGLDQVGIYRLSGTTSKVQKLKAALDTNMDAVDVMSSDWSGDINVVASVLKQWLRELPEPLLTHGLYQGFIDAARYDNDRLRHIRLHEQVNELPDSNYATLKFFMGHLDKIRRQESVNQMSSSNLSIVFGPTLLGAPPEMGGMNLEHMSFQCKAIETILERYREIFVEEEEAPPEQA